MYFNSTFWSVFAFGRGGENRTPIKSFGVQNDHPLHLLQVHQLYKKIGHLVNYF